MEKPSVREMIRRASRPGGLGVSQAARPDASPVEGTCPKSSSPEAGEGKRQQGRQGFVRVVGWIPCLKAQYSAGPRTAAVDRALAPPGACPARRPGKGRRPMPV